MSGFATDYVEVADRLIEFYARYPEGSIQSDPPQFVTVNGQEWVVMRAYAYRSPDDPRPGIGTAWELIPGRTPYTKTSEVMVGETSAWGRALAALGISTKRGVASAEEVRAAQSRQAPPPTTLDMDEVASRIATMDLEGLREVYRGWHRTPQWREIEPLVNERRAQLEAV